MLVTEREWRVLRGRELRMGDESRRLSKSVICSLIPNQNKYFTLKFKKTMEIIIS